MATAITGAAIADPTKKPPVDPNDPNAGPLGVATNPDAMTNAIGDPRPVSQLTPQPADPITPPAFYDPRPGVTGAPTPAAPTSAATPPDPFAASGGGQYNATTGQWVPNNNAAALTAAGLPSAPATPGAQPGTTPQPAAPVTPAAATPATVGTDESGPYQAALLKALGDAQTPASIGDAALKNQSDAYAVGQSRATDQARSAMAERAAAEGGTGTSSGAFDQGVLGLIGQQGENQGAYNANLVGQANQAKLAQLQSTLSQMGSDVNSQAGRDLQQQIATMQNQVQKDSLAEQAREANQSSANQVLGINSQTQLGQGDLALRDKLGTGGLNAQIAQMLLQNQQFGQSLGAQTGEFSAGMNQQSLLQLLGMI